MTDGFNAQGPQLAFYLPGQCTYCQQVQSRTSCPSPNPGLQHRREQQSIAVCWHMNKSKQRHENFCCAVRLQTLRVCSRNWLNVSNTKTIQYILALFNSPGISYCYCVRPLSTCTLKLKGFALLWILSIPCWMYLSCGRQAVAVSFDARVHIITPLHEPQA